MLAPSSTRGTAAVRRSYVECGFGQLHLCSALPRTGGFEEPVSLVCFHGRGQTGRMFARFLPLMAQDRPAYAIDLPGHGESDVPEDGLVFEDSVAAVIRLLDELLIPRMDVLAVGEGVAFALEIARQRQTLIRKVLKARGRTFGDASHTQTWGGGSGGVLVAASMQHAHGNLRPTGAQGPAAEVHDLDLSFEQIAFASPHVLSIVRQILD